MIRETIETPDSSNIRRVEYEGNNLFVEFKTGNIYRYENIPYRMFEAFRTEPSAGKYFGTNIRNKYNYTRIV